MTDNKSVSTLDASRSDDLKKQNESATKVQAAFRGFLSRTEYIMPLRLRWESILELNSGKRNSSLVSVLTMKSEGHSNQSLWLGENDVRSRFLADNVCDPGPILVPSRISSGCSHPSLSENHPGFQSSEMPIDTCFSPRRPTRIPSKDPSTAHPDDEGHLLFSPNAVDAAFIQRTSPKTGRKGVQRRCKIANMLSYSPLPVKRGVRALGRSPMRSPTRQTYPDIVKDLPVGLPSRKISKDLSLGPL